jgi:hypothetical protein
MKRSTYNFNKELLFAEIGAVIGAPLLPFIITLLTDDHIVLSVLTVIGAQAGATTIWLITRIYNQKIGNIFSVKKLARDIAYFTPAAFLIASITYYPTLYFTTHYFLEQKEHILLAAILGEILAFVLFMTVINVYRVYLIKYYDVEL